MPQTAGHVPTADELNALGETVQTVEKTADETVTSSTTFQTDDELTIPSVALGTWELTGEIWITGTSATAADFKMRFSWPAGSGGTITYTATGLHIDWANTASNRDVEIAGVLKATASPTSQAEFGTVTGSSRPVRISGRMTNLAVGDLILSWAQNTSNATGTAVKAGSWLTVRKVA